MIGYDLMENDRPANISRYNGTYSTHMFANKVKDLLQEQESSKVWLVLQTVYRCDAQIYEITLKSYYAQITKFVLYLLYISEDCHK